MLSLALRLSTHISLERFNLPPSKVRRLHSVPQTWHALPGMTQVSCPFAAQPWQRTPGIYSNIVLRLSSIMNQGRKKTRVTYRDRDETWLRNINNWEYLVTTEAYARHLGHKLRDAKKGSLERVHFKRWSEPYVFSRELWRWYFQCLKLLIRAVVLTINNIGMGFSTFLYLSSTLSMEHLRSTLQAVESSIESSTRRVN